jgi:hypothetical protein
MGWPEWGGHEWFEMLSTEGSAFKGSPHPHRVPVFAAQESAGRPFDPRRDLLERDVAR